MEFLAVASVMVPFLMAWICFIFKNEKVRNTVLVISAIAMIKIVAIFAFVMISSNAAALSINTATISRYVNINFVVEFLDLVLFAYIAYIGLKLKKWFLLILTVLQAIPLIIFEATGFFGHHEPVFVVDYLSLIMLILIAVIGSILVVFAIGYMDNHEKHLKLKISKKPRFFAILLIFLAAMNGLVISDNLLWVYFFWEVTTLCSFLLISHDQDEQSIKNAIRALWMNLLGGVAFLLGIVIFYKACGTLSISELMASIKDFNIHFAAWDLFKMLPMALVLFCFAAFTKSAQFPFQSWLLGAMVAPTPVSALLHSSTMVKAGVYLVVRFSPLFPITGIGQLVAIIGGFTFLAASAIAISQRNSKKVLAYSTIANLGLIVCCAGIASKISISAAVMLIIFHAISKALMFVCVGTIEQEIGSRDIEDMQGLMKKMPVTTVIAIIGMVSMLLPPFGVLMTKWIAIESAIHIPIVLIFIILGSALTVVFWSKWIGLISTVSYKSRYYVEKQRGSIRMALVTLTSLVVLASLFVFLIYDNLVRPYIRTIAYYLLDKRISIVSSILGMQLESGMGEIGGFISLLFFVVLLFIVLLVMYFVRKTKSESIKPPYMCGENIEDVRGIEFIGPSDKATRMIVHNYYLQGWFDEKALTFWANLIATALAVVLFGMVVR